MVVSILDPLDIVHPNILGSYICLGPEFGPTTPIALVLWELYDILAYQNFTTDERNAFNSEACRVLRAHPDVLTRLSFRPFMRRKLEAQVQVKAI